MIDGLSSMQTRHDIIENEALKQLSGFYYASKQIQAIRTDQLAGTCRLEAQFNLIRQNHTEFRIKCGYPKISSFS